MSIKRHIMEYKKAHDLKEELKGLSDEELKIRYIPDVYQKDIYQIDYDLLKAKGIKVISFDIDDTIRDNALNVINGITKIGGAPRRAEGLMRHLRLNGFKVALLSNGDGSLYEKLAEDLDVDDFVPNANKPEADGFNKIAKRFGVKPSQMAHVGNDIYRDVFGGNRFGATTCLVRRNGVFTKAGRHLRPHFGINIRAELRKRGMWSKYPIFEDGDQFYQLDSITEYQAIEQNVQLPKADVTIFYDGKSSYATALDLNRYIKSLGYKTEIKDDEDYYNNYPGKIIIIGYHSFAEDQLDTVTLKYDCRGIRFGFSGNKCVLFVDRSSLGIFHKKFKKHYNATMPRYKKLAEEYRIPLEFSDREGNTREAQLNLLWLEFVNRGLSEFLSETNSNNSFYQALFGLLSKR